MCCVLLFKLLYLNGVIPKLHIPCLMSLKQILMVIILQAVLRQLGHFGHETVMVDEAELQCHHQLQIYTILREQLRYSQSVIKTLPSNTSIYLFGLVGLMDE